MSSRYSQGVAWIFFSTGSRLLSCRFTGSRWVILLNGFQTIVQQVLRESLGHSSRWVIQRVLDNCPVDSQGDAGLFFSTGSRLLYSRFPGSRWVILLNGFQAIVQQMYTGSRCLILLNGFQTIVQQIHRESLGYSSQRILDYCPVDSQEVAGLFFPTGSRLLSSRFSGSRWVILINGFQTIFQQIHRESLGYSSQRVLDYCPVDSQGVARLFFSTGSRQLSSRFTGRRWVILLNGFQAIVQQILRESLVILLNGFQTIVQQILRESLGYSSQRVLDYFPVDSQAVAGLFFSTGSRLLSSRFTGSRSVILLNGFQTIVKQIHRESLGYSSQRVLEYCLVDSQRDVGLFFSTGSRLLSSRFTGRRWVILLNGFQNIVQQIHRESLGYSSQRVPDYCPVDSEGFAGSFFSTGSRLLSSRFTGSRCVILLNGFQTNVQQIFTGSRWDFLLNGFQTVVLQIHRESLGYSSQRVRDYCPVGSQGVAGSFFSTGSRLLSTRFTGSRWVILLNGSTAIVQQILRESLGYSSQQVLDYCPVYSQGAAGLFFSTASRLLSSRFSGSRWVILLNGFQTNVQQIFTGSRWDFLLNGFQTIVKQIHWESLGYSSQRVPNYCPVDSEGFAGSFFSTGSRLLSSRFTGSRCVILLNGFQTNVQQIFTGSRWDFLLNGFQTVVLQIHRESLGYSSQRVRDYCPVGSQGVAGSFFSTGSRLLSTRFTGSRWVILLNGSTAIVQQILRESLGNSSQRVLDYCPVYSQGGAGLFFSTASRLLSSRFSGSRWVILLNGFQTNVQQIFTGSRWDFLLNGFQTIVKQIHWESLGYSSQRVPNYCPVDSEGFAGSFFSTGSRLLSSRFTGSRWVILLSGFQTIVQYILREPLGYSSQRLPDYCQVDFQGVAGLFSSTGSRLMSSRYSQGVAWIFFSTGSRLLSCRFTGSRWVILLNGFQTIVQQVLRESLGHSSQRVLDYCSGDSRDSLGYFSQRVQDHCPVDVHRESLGYSSQRVLDYCPVDSPGLAGLFLSTGSRQLSSGFTRRRWVILLNGFQTIVQQISRESLGYSSQRVLDYCPADIHRESLCYSSQRVLDYCPVDSQGVAGLFFSTDSRLLSSRFTGSRWVILPNGFQTIVQQILRESLGYFSQRVLDYFPVDSQVVAGLFFSTGSRLLSSRFTGSRSVILYSSQRVLDNCPVDSQGDAGLFFSTGSRLLYSRFSGSRWLFFSTVSRLLSSRFSGSRWVILLNGFQTIFQQIHRESLGYSSQRVLEYCLVDSQRVVVLFFSTGSRLLSSRYLQGVAGLFFSTGCRLLSSRYPQ